MKLILFGKRVTFSVEPAEVYCCKCSELEDPYTGRHGTVEQCSKVMGRPCDRPEEHHSPDWRYR